MPPTVLCQKLFRVYVLVDCVLCRVVPLVITLVAGESLQWMNLVSHCTETCSVPQYKSLRFLTALLIDLIFYFARILVESTVIALAQF